MRVKNKKINHATQAHCDDTREREERHKEIGNQNKLHAQRGCKASTVIDQDEGSGGSSCIDKVSVKDTDK